MRLGENRKQLANIRYQFTVPSADVILFVKAGATERKNVYNLLRYIKSILPVARKLYRTQFLFHGRFAALKMWVMNSQLEEVHIKDITNTCVFYFA